VQQRASDTGMEKPIQVTYRWSQDEVLILNRIHMRYSATGRKLRRSMRSGGVIFMCMGALLLCAIGGTLQKWRAAAFGLAFIAGGAALLAGVPFFMRRAALSSYAKKPDRDLLVTLEFGEQGLSCKSDVAFSELLWCTICRVLRTREGFLLYLSDMQVHWLPVHGFQGTDALERFAQLAKAKVDDYRDER
jgi:hypothetical protein